MSQLYQLELYELCYKSFHLVKALPSLDMRLTFKCYETEDLTVYTAQIKVKQLEELKISSIAGYLTAINFMNLSHLTYILDEKRIEDNLQLQVCTPKQKNLPVGERLKLKVIMCAQQELHVLQALASLKFPKLKIMDQIIDPKEIDTYKPSMHIELRTKDALSLSREQVRAITCIPKNMIIQHEDRKASISIVEGPPGSGKSRVAANIGLQILVGEETIKKSRVLICASSESGADQLTRILEEIIKNQPPEIKLQLVRCGDQRFVNKDFHKLAPMKLASVKLSKEIENAVKLLDKELPLHKERMSMLDKKRQLKKDNKLKELEMLNDRLRVLECHIYCKKMNLEKLPFKALCEKKAEEELNNSSLVVTTLSHCGILLQSKQKFNICIVDDANLANELMTLKPLAFGVEHLVLIGDPQQNPPALKSSVGKLFT